MITLEGIVLKFTPTMSTIGGLIIGLVAITKMAVNGRILGISGIYGGLYRGALEGWRLAFLLGMGVGSVWLLQFMPGLFGAIPATFPMWQICAGGALVGIGAAMGNGCTSGHGVCGLSRRSVRSLAHVCTFMTVAMVTAQLFGTAAKLGVTAAPVVYEKALPGQATLGTQVLGMAAAALLAFLALGRVLTGRGDAQRLDLASEVVEGLLMSVGLGLGGMLQPQKVVGFLSVFRPYWDPSLACVMGGAVAITLPAFYFLQTNMKASAVGTKLGFPSSNVVDRKLLLGAALFGIGWGLCGLCPGPALASLALGTKHVIANNVSLAIGLFAYHNWLYQYMD